MCTQIITHTSRTLHATYETMTSPCVRAELVANCQGYKCYRSVIIIIIINITIIILVEVFFSPGCLKMNCIFMKFVINYK